MNKQVYEKPEVTLTVFVAQDIVKTSTNDNYLEWGWLDGAETQEEGNF